MSSSGPGWLRRSAWWLDGPTYVLLNSQGQVIAYVTPQPGLNLEPWVNRNVRVLGAVAYRGDIRQYHIRAAHVERLQ
jgi:hypothetical protein